MKNTFKNILSVQVLSSPLLNISDIVDKPLVVPFDPSLSPSLIHRVNIGRAKNQSFFPLALVQYTKHFFG